MHTGFIPCMTPAHYSQQQRGTVLNDFIEELLWWCLASSEKA